MRIAINCHPVIKARSALVCVSGSGRGVERTASEIGRFAPLDNASARARVRRVRGDHTTEHQPIEQCADYRQMPFNPELGEVLL